MQRTTCIALLGILTGCIVVPPLFGADFAPIFPEQSASMVSAPNITWVAGDYDYFVLCLRLPIPVPGYYYRQIPVPRYQEPYWRLPDAWWDLVQMDGWCLWRVLAVNTKSLAYELTAWKDFQKVSDCVVEFPDPALEGIIRAEIGKPVGSIMASELEQIHRLDARRLGIHDVGGLEYCMNLTELNLSRNEIVDVSPLAGLNALQTLNLWGNDIVDVSPLASLNALQTLKLSINEIVDVSPLAGLTGLETLSLCDNAIQDVSPLAGLTDLKTLTLCYMDFVDVSPLAGLKGLEKLNLVYNNIVDVSPLAGMTNLTVLYMWNNEIVDVSPLAGLTNLIELDLRDNQVADICPLVGNPGLGYGDWVSLRSNPLSADTCTVCIPQLEGSGVRVIHGCP